MEKLVESIKNVFKIPELRNRIYFTFGILVLYRIGCWVLVPGIDKNEVWKLFEQSGSGILSMANMFTGGALKNAAVFALGIMPYITASIILQILQKSVPFLDRLSKEGEQGRNKINRYTRYLTVVFAVLHSWGITQMLISMDASTNLIRAPFDDKILLFRFVVMLTLTTGAIVIMWLGEKITEGGIGNGISLIIFASIVIQVPDALVAMFKQTIDHQVPATTMALVLAMVVATVVFVVFFELGIRKITIQYAKRATANGQMAGGNSYLPFKVNSAGVIPVIFSSSIIQVPSVLSSFMGQGSVEGRSEFVVFMQGLFSQLSYGRPFSNLIFFVATMFFTFFYVEMLFSPKDTAENLKKHGGFIPGIRPGSETQVYIEGVLTRLTFWGGLYLSLVSLVPMFIMGGLQLQTLPDWLGGEWFGAHLPSAINNGTNIHLAMTLGGTSLLIIVSVALDFVNQVENQLIMRKYDGFTSGSKKAMMRTRRYG